MGEVEQGVYATLLDYGIHDPRTAVEKLAVRLGNAIDNVKYAKDLPPLALQLRETLEKVKEQPHARPKTENDAVSNLIDRQ
jgi:hypothetical protein